MRDSWLKKLVFAGGKTYDYFQKMNSFLNDSRIKGSPLLEVRFISGNARSLAKEFAIAGGDIY
jgi:hypothetical protein